MIGFSPECKNGGQKNLRGDCYCPDFYKGEYCENIICLNNGTKYSALSHIDSTIMIDYCRFFFLKKKKNNFKLYFKGFLFAFLRFLKL